jgi:hypothetical protein
MPPNERHERLRQFGDSFYDAVDGPCHQTDSERHGNVDLWELYARGNVACHFHLSVYSARQSHSHNLCADFQVAVPKRTLPAVREVEIGSGLGGKGSVVKMDHLGSQQQRVESPVFVLVGEFSECSEGTPGRVRSIVGLRDVDNCPVAPWDFTEMFPLVSERVAAVLNGELDLIAQSFRLGHAKVVATERIKQVVESTTKVVDDVSQDDADAESPILWDCCDAKDMLARLRVQLGANLNKIGFGGASAQDWPNYGVQSVAMLPRPLDLGPTLSKVNHHA